EERENISPGEATMRILETEGSLRTIYHFGHEDDLKRIMQHPTTAIASDGGATTSDQTHPRRYGTQPRRLSKCVGEEEHMDWEGELTGIQAGQALKREPNMPSRTMNTSEKIELDERGELFLKNEATNQSDPFIEISVEQDADAKDIEGFFHMIDPKNDIEFQSEHIGNIQITDGWASLTGRGIINDCDERTFSVIIDENEQLMTDQRPTVTIKIDGMNEIKGFLAMSAAHMVMLVDHFHDDGAFVNDEAPRHLKTHLKSVDHYKKNGQTDKALKHLAGFKTLLNAQKEKEWIKEDAFTQLLTYTDQLIEEW